MIVEINKHLIYLNEVSRVRNFDRVIIIDYIDKSRDYTVIEFDYNQDINTSWRLLKQATEKYRKMKILTIENLEA